MVILTFTDDASAFASAPASDNDRNRRPRMAPPLSLSSSSSSSSSTTTTKSCRKRTASSYSSTSPSVHNNARKRQKRETNNNKRRSPLSPLHENTPRKRTRFNNNESQPDVDVDMCDASTQKESSSERHRRKQVRREFAKHSKQNTRSTQSYHIPQQNSNHNQSQTQLNHSINSNPCTPCQPQRTTNVEESPFVAHHIEQVIDISNGEYNEQIEKTEKEKKDDENEQSATDQNPVLKHWFLSPSRLLLNVIYGSERKVAVFVDIPQHQMY